MYKHSHHDFPSDLFVILDAVDAKLTIIGTGNTELLLSMTEFLRLDMNKKLVYNIILKRYSSSYIFRSYKVIALSEEMTK